MAHDFLQFLCWGLGTKILDTDQLSDIKDKKAIMVRLTSAASGVHDYQQEGFL